MRLMEALCRRTGDEQQESRQEGGGLRGSLTLTMEPQSVTLIALSDSVSCFPPAPLFLSVIVSFAPSLSLFLSSLVSLLAPSESSLPAMAAKMHHRHLSAAAHPPLTSRLLFFQTSGFKKSTAY